MDKELLSKIEQGLHQVRTQIKADTAGRADPAISNAVRSRQQGPAVLTPGIGNGRF